MHELYTLEQIAIEGYGSHNFPKGFVHLPGILISTQKILVVNALTNFANITLSSLYFDITKDSLYANRMENPERMAIVAVLEQVMKFINLDMDIS